MYLSSYLILAALDWTNCQTDGIATLKCLPLIFSSLINVLIMLGGATAVVLVILGGIRFLLSGGDPAKVEGAKKTVTFALIGVALILFSFVAIKIISSVTGVECNVLGIDC